MKMVLVEWVDSFGCSPSWEELPQKGSKVTCMVCRSLGWLVYEDDKVIVVAPHLSNEHDKCAVQACGEMTIPKVAVIRCVMVKEDERIQGVAE